MADFGLIDRFHRLALAEMLFAAMPVFWRFIRPDLTGRDFANALWKAPRLGHHNLAKVDGIRGVANTIAILTMMGQRIHCGK